MADPEVQISGGKPPVEADVEMEGDEDGPEVTEIGSRGSAVGGAAAEEDDKPAPRLTFVEYAVPLCSLKSANSTCSLAYLATSNPP